MRSLLEKLDYPPSLIIDGLIHVLTLWRPVACFHRLFLFFGLVSAHATRIPK